MKANLLDDIFKSQLKDNDKVPESVMFNKERVLNSLEKRLNNRSKSYKVVGYTMIVLLLIGSSYWNWQQESIIQLQKEQLAQQAQVIYSIVEESQQKVALHQVMVDSLTISQTTTKPVLSLQPLPSLPAMVVTHKVCVAKMPTLIINEPLLSIDKKLPNHNKSSVPELGLPVYYESERLANHSTDASKKQSFGKKLNSLINN